MGTRIKVSTARRCMVPRVRVRAGRRGGCELVPEPAGRPHSVRVREVWVVLVVV